MLEIACENAAEGCVRETFGAALAMWQASHSGDADIRSTMLRIADDETQHAELAWEIADWFAQSLTTEEQAEVGRVRARAISTLRAQLSSVPTYFAVLGLPSKDETSRLFDALNRHVWAA